MGRWPVPEPYSHGPGRILQAATRARAGGRGQRDGRGRQVRWHGVSIADVLDGKRICVCAGPGGVGKTTVSAAIALGMAARGARVAVVTIDPARRLADALGLDALGNRPQRVDPGALGAEGLDIEGELWAMMLDPKRTFDELIERLAPDARTRDEVLANRVYRELSTAVAGTQEFTAIAKLFELHEEGGFDLVVLDTPPSRNALDFLDAPDRLSRFFEGRALQALLGPAGFGMKLVGRGTGLVFGVLGKATGVDVLRDVSVFFRALGGMVDGFRDRARRVAGLLEDPGTTFVLVASPEPEAVDEAIFFARKLRDAGMELGAAVVNRALPAGVGAADPDRAERALAGRVEPGLAARAAHALADLHALALRDRESVERLAAEVGAQRLIRVPQLEGDVHDAGGLAQVLEHLLAGGEHPAGARTAA